MSRKIHRVCMMGGFAPDYPRYQIIRVGLERNGVEVKPVTLSPNTNALELTLQLPRSWHETGDCDAVIVPPFNALLGPTAWLMGQLTRKPVLIDYMVGLTDSITEERGETSNAKAAIYRLVDRINVNRMTSLTD